MFNCFLSLSVSVPVSDACVNVLSIVVFFSLNFSFSDMFLFLKIICNLKYVLLAFFYSFLQVYLVIVTFIKYNSQIFNIFHSFKFIIFYFQMSYYFIFLSTIIYFVSWFLCSPNFLAMFSISTVINMLRKNSTLHLSDKIMTL